jgi:hypothetical protein
MNERSEIMRGSSLSLLDAVIVAFVIIGFFCLLSFYGYALLPFVPDEIYFLQPAQNLAEGKGMGTPALDDLLPGISQRTYWQPPVYFLVLAVWGNLVGFDVMSSRLLSRVCGVGVLLLLWLLALRWGICSQLALVCVIWTALDLSFQYNSNSGRMDTMNALWLMACLLAFTEHRRGGKIWQAAAAGFFGALATLTHFIAIPSVLTLALVLAWRKRWRELLWFLLPVLLGWGMWLIYAAQDWQSFWAQLYYQFSYYGKGGYLQSFSGVLSCFLFYQSFSSLFDLFIVNSPPIWFSLTLVSFLAWKRKFLPFQGWQMALILVIYCSAALGGKLSYVGWFTPFGYLLLSLWFQQAFKENRWRFVLVGLCLLWCGYQGFRVGQALSSVRDLKAGIDRFNFELVNILPRGAQISLGTIPDPSPTLQRLRPDLRLFQLIPLPISQEAFERILLQSEFAVGFTPARVQGVTFGKPIKEWRFHAPLGSWSVRLYDLREGKPCE